MENIIQKYKKLRQSEIYQLTSNWIQFSIIGIIGYFTLYFKTQHIPGIGLVIMFGGVFYSLVYLYEIKKMNQKETKLKNIKFIKQIFRLIYTAIYLTAIMIDIIHATGINRISILVLKGLLFIWILIWGTRDLWIARAKYLYERIINIDEQTKRALTKKFIFILEVIAVLLSALAVLYATKPYLFIV